MPQENTSGDAIEVVINKLQEIVGKSNDDQVPVMPSNHVTSVTKQNPMSQTKELVMNIPGGQISASSTEKLLDALTKINSALNKVASKTPISEAKPVKGVGGENIYKCEQCDYWSHNKYYWKQHVDLVHNAERVYKCPFCDYAGKRSHSLKEHLVVHSNYRPYECRVCNATFRKKAHLTNHVRLHSQSSGGEEGSEGDSVEDTTCWVCKVTLSNKNALFAHLRTLHKSDASVYLCDMCPFATTQKPYMVTHMNKHGNYKILQCNTCGYQACHLNILIGHMQMSHPDLDELSYTAVEPDANTNKPVILMKCTECGFTAGSTDALRQHMYQHVDQQQYENRQQVNKPTNLSVSKAPTSLQLVDNKQPLQDTVVPTEQTVSEDEQYTYSCEHCSFSCMEAYRFINHMAAHKPKEFYKAFGKNIASRDENSQPSTSSSVTSSLEAVISSKDKLSACSSASYTACASVSRVISATSGMASSQQEAGKPVCTVSSSQNACVVTSSRPVIPGAKPVSHAGEVTKNGGGGWYQCTICGYLGQPRTIKAHIWKHSGHKDIAYPMFEEEEASTKDVEQLFTMDVPSVFNSNSSVLKTDNENVKNDKAELIFEKGEEINSKEYEKNRANDIPVVLNGNSAVLKMYNKSKKNYIVIRDIPSAVKRYDTVNEGHVHNAIEIKNETESVKEHVAINDLKIGKDRRSIEEKNYTKDDKIVKTGIFSNDQEKIPNHSTGSANQVVAKIVNIRKNSEDSGLDSENSMHANPTEDNCNFQIDVKELKRKSDTNEEEEGLQKAKRPRTEVINSEEEIIVENEGEKSIENVQDKKELNESPCVEIAHNINGDYETMEIRSGDEAIYSLTPNADECIGMEVEITTQQEEEEDNFDELDDVEESQLPREMISGLKHRSQEEVLALLALLQQGKQPPVNDKQGICNSLLTVIEQLRERSKQQQQISDESDTLVDDEDDVNEDNDNLREEELDVEYVMEDVSVDQSKKKSESNIPRRGRPLKYPRLPAYNSIKVCPWCSFMTSSPTAMKSHWQDVHGTMEDSVVPMGEHDCTLCQYSAQSSVELQEHMLLKHCNKRRLRSFPCRLCNEVFHYKSRLQYHLNNLCPGTVGNSRKEQIDHQYTYASNDTQESGENQLECLRCEQCCETFESESDHEQHSCSNVDNQLSSIDARPTCNICGVANCSKKHRFVSVHQCDECEAKFSSSMALKTHMKRVHRNHKTNYTPAPHVVEDKGNVSSLQCDLCDFLATSVRSLKSHMKRHRNDQRFVEQPLEQYKCNLCGYVCHHLPSLKSHMWRHASDSKYSYQQTNTVINKALDNKKEVSTSFPPASVITFRCCHCGFESTEKTELNTHMQSHNDIIQKTLQANKGRILGKMIEKLKDGTTAL